MGEYQLYTEDQVHRILDRGPHPQYVFPNRDKWSSYQRRYLKRSSNYFYTPEYVLKEKRINGNIYWQGDEPTCTAWTIVNGVHVLGLRPRASWLTPMLNFALDPYYEGEYGLEFREAAHFLRQEDDLDFDFMEEMNWITSSSEFREFVEHRIDSGNTILTGVDSRAYLGDQFNIPHAICIAGYRIFRSGKFQIQVLDSADGKIWTTPDHLFYSIDDDFFTITKDLMGVGMQARNTKLSQVIHS